MNVLVPFRPTGKTRLAGVLSAGARGRVAARMRDHVLSVCAQAEMTPALLEAPGLVEAVSEGLTACVGPTLVLMADLPLLTAEDLRALPRGRLAVAADRRGVGVNAVMLPEPDALPVLLGGGASLARHLAAVPDAAVIRRPGLAFDLDEVQDWTDLCALDPGWLSLR